MNSENKPYDLDLIPEDPGVYLMKDAEGSVIYVGKAVNLRNRLRSYFSESPKGNSKVLAMIARIDHFDYILCNNETEALLLECNLIKQHKPRYNVLLRDDKEYPYIRITWNEEYPRVQKAFRVGEDVSKGAKYYGPYMAGHLKTALETLQSIFPMKSCSLVLPRDMNKNRPCLNYFIGKCMAPCQGSVTMQEYRALIADITAFLEGRYEGLLHAFEEQMQQAAQGYDYERAAVFRDRLNSLKRLMDKQIVTDPSGKDRDVIGYASDPTGSCIRKLEIRKGRLIGSAVLFSFEEEGERGDILSKLILQHYSDAASIPRRIDLPFSIPDQELMEQALSVIAGRKVNVGVPQKGRGRKMMELSMSNAMEALRKHALNAQRYGGTGAQATAVLSGLLNGNDHSIKRMEAFDVSNYAHSDISAAMVVYINGKAQRSEYRLFRIRDMDRQDDYEALRQAVRRRLLRIQSDSQGFRDKPSLILVDGGIMHVQAADAVLRETGNEDIHLLGMVKDHKHKTRALVHRDGRETPLDLTEENNPLSAENQRILMRLIAGIQNEAHRFALNYTRKLAGKRTMRYSLESIRGIGPAKRRSLLEVFGSIRKIAQAEMDDLKKVKGINDDTAMAVYRYFHP